MLSDDKGNRQKAKVEGLEACSTKDYVNQLPTEERERLVDLVAGGVDDEDGVGKQLKSKKLYEEYLPLATLQAGVKAGRYHQGHFNASQYNYLEGTVSVPAYTKRVLLVGRENMNRSVDGDMVVVEVFPKSEWKAPGEEVVDQDGELTAPSGLTVSHSQGR